jgi:hypothetical protein
MGKYKGNDLYGNPKMLYINKLRMMNDKQLSSECECMIWLAARSAEDSFNYFWQVDACSDEAKRRKKESLFNEAQNTVLKIKPGEP